MKQALQYPKRGELKIENTPAPALKRGGVIIRNSASLLSAGTERSIIEMAEKSLLGKARNRPDLVRQVIQKARAEGVLNTYRKVKGKLESPIPLGYSCAGIVTEISKEVSEFTIGQRVAAAGFGYASHAEMVFVPKNLTVPIPADISMEEASFVTVGAIALQGIRQVEPRLGETVVVIGLGLLGQLTIQMLRANGCVVIGIDIDDRRMTMAKNLGCEMIVNSDSLNGPTEVMNLTGGMGADSVVITAASTSADIMNQAAEMCRDRARITVVGAVRMDLERRPFYNKELTVNMSRSYGPGRYDTNYEEKGIDYPVGYVRWTEKRNMESFLKMIERKQINVRDLITHRFNIDDATDAYDLIMGRINDDYLGVVLKYPEENMTSDSAVRNVIINRPRSSVSAKDRIIGAVGTGEFSMGVLYPIISSMSNVGMKHIVSATGSNAVGAARRFNFEKAGTSFEEMLSDKTINSVIIATPHYLHADQVIMALKAGKDVFVEKPLATNRLELDTILKEYKNNEGILMVGLNRRFSPAAMAVKKQLAQFGGPAMFTYRINAGFVPKDHPIQDSEIGKGRIIGEVCHFVDLITYLCGSEINSVSATGMTFKSDKLLSMDNVQIQMTYKDGSVAAITYVACGGKGLAKERIEIHSMDKSFVIDDFKTATMYSNGKAKKLYSGSQDKGHLREMEIFLSQGRNASDMNAVFREAVMVTEATFEIEHALHSNSLSPRKEGWRKRMP